MELPELNQYPNLQDFVNNYCVNCQRKCEIPSLSMFSCILKKINFEEKPESNKGEGSHG